MKKQEIKDKLKKYGYTVITKSWYFGKPEEKSVLFTAYDSTGTCHQFYINWGAATPWARRQLLSPVGIIDPCDATKMFFKEAK